MASSDPKLEVFRSTRNSYGAPAESPVKRRTVRETGRVSDRVHTSQTTAAHTAQDRSGRDPPGTTPSRGPEQVQRGESPAPPLRQGPAAGTMSPVLGRPPRAPRSRPLKPWARAPGAGGRHHCDGKANRSSESETWRRAPIQGQEARPRGTLPATAKAQGRVPSNNGHWVPRSREARTTHDELRHRSRCQGKPGPHTRTLHPKPVGSRPRLHTKMTGGRVWGSPCTQRPTPRKRAPPRPGRP